MSQTPAKWLQDFDTAMKELFCINHADAGLDDVEAVDRYRDLSPRNAALQFGEDYDLQRTDLDWLRPVWR